MLFFDCHDLDYNNTNDRENSKESFGPRRDKTCLQEVLTKRDSNKYSQLHRLARILKISLKASLDVKLSGRW